MKVKVGEHEINVVRSAGGDPTRPVLVALHGGPGLDQGYLARALGGLSGVSEVITYDQLGNGASDRPAVIPGAMPERADEVVAVLDALGLDRVILLGHSWGGYVAQEAALRHPGRFVGLILTNTGPALDYPGVLMANAQARATPEQMAVVLRAFTQPMPSDEAYAELYPTILPLYFHAPQPAYVAWLVANTSFSAAALNHGMGVCMPGWDASARLAGLTVPTLVLTGDDDWITPAAWGADRLANGIPGATRVVLEDCGHYPFEEQPQAFFETVGGWLDKTFGPR